MMTFGAAKHVDRDILQFGAQFLADDIAAVRMAMSSSMALRRSPKPGP
jgi:hypothetical protein